MAKKKRSGARSLTRRRLLLGAGAVTLVAAGGLVWRAVDRGAFAEATGPAFSPWTLWNDPSVEGTPLALVAAGILASNPHNSQPWIFRVSDREIDVAADTSRNLASFDPYLREMHIGLGCALENMLLAAPHNGFTARYEARPGSLTEITTRADPVTAFRLILAPIDETPKDALTQTLYAAIPHRHTNRASYDFDAGLPDETGTTLARLSTSQAVSVATVTAPASRADLSRLVVQATAAIIADPDMTHDVHHWFRTTMGQVETQRDGISLHTSGLPDWMVAAARILPDVSVESSNAGWLSSTKTGLETSPMLGLIGVQDRYDRPQTLEAGRTWQRIHLWAAAHGVAVQPINQPPEWVDRERVLQRTASMADALGSFLDGDKEATFVFRAGRPTQAAHASARRPLSEVVTPLV